MNPDTEESSMLMKDSTTENLKNTLSVWNSDFFCFQVHARQREITAKTLIAEVSNCIFKKKNKSDVVMLNYTSLHLIDKNV